MATASNTGNRSWGGFSNSTRTASNTGTTGTRSYSSASYGGRSGGGARSFGGHR